MSKFDKNTVISLGHSPDPDDAFMFYAMAQEKIDLRGYRFEHRLEDIETLNQRALRGELHISAVSIHAYASLLDRYALFASGASMGDGYGPMLISAKPNPSNEELASWIGEKKIAIPGTLTSAFLALKLYLGHEDFDYVVVPFDEIFDVVRQGEAELGLIIHEGQLTYGTGGFHKILDLGEWWKADTGLPLPLGGNAVRKDVPLEVRREWSDILKESIAYGLAHRAPAVAHSMPYARDMDSTLADRFIGMYVNDYTLDYGERGREAISLFLKRGHAMGFLPQPVEVEFVA